MGGEKEEERRKDGRKDELKEIVGGGIGSHRVTVHQLLLIRLYTDAESHGFLTPYFFYIYTTHLRN